MRKMIYNHGFSYQRCCLPRYINLGQESFQLRLVLNTSNTAVSRDVSLKKTKVGIGKDNEETKDSSLELQQTVA